MNQPKYSKEELEIIKNWGISSDTDFDTKRNAYSADGNLRITAFVLAKQRKDILEKLGKTLISNNNFKKAT